MACIHGFAPGQCLICSTLQSGDQAGAGKQTATRAATPTPATTSAPVLTATPPPAPTSIRHPRTHEGRGTRSPAPIPSRPPRPHGRTFTEVLIFLALIAAAVIAVGLSTEIIRGLIHILEVAFVGVVAGTIGYGAGRLHGAVRRHEREHDDHRH